MKIIKPKNLDIWLYCLVFCCIFAGEVYLMIKFLKLIKENVY